MKYGSLSLPLKARGSSPTTLLYLIPSRKPETHLYNLPLRLASKRATAMANAWNMLNGALKSML
jgi:hypothetical protein